MKIKFLFLMMIFAIPITANAANVVVRPGAATANAQTSRAKPTAASVRGSVPIASEVQVLVDEIPAETTSVFAIDNSRFDRFNAVFGDAGGDAVGTDSGLKDLITAQRAAAGTTDISGDVGMTLKSGGYNSCDTDLRQCMKDKCGDNFIDCAGDDTTVWSSKIESCGATAKCSGAEMTMFAPEVLSDRDMAVKLAEFDHTKTCGVDYRDCMVRECGKTFDKCLGKNYGDAAIKACQGIADSCADVDTGFAARMMQVFADNRISAETRITKLDAALYDLRDSISKKCTGAGMLFDERAFDCVASVSLYSAEDGATMASQKLYAGDTFDCTENWFGVDITTYLENSLRRDRELTGAADAMMGAGLGSAAAAVTSGLMDNLSKLKAQTKAEEALGPENTNNSTATETNNSTGNNTTENNNTTAAASATTNSTSGDGGSGN
ncbi:MAG: hypothetical protein LBL75_01525 [Rickettsiales bacterium]|jgi:hypothetical protein|nr:hypothetical protein [Rickettsiales bacterium]